ncbi:class I mannose-6-phosphate isomerase [Sphingomonas sp. SUN039]|uniref:class I mannose-6-phosphate isomerase n=1 Tax=Sphingomonas sp. SUN039 TaxID=2937787 RepID=UPI002164E0DE|nr:class I mannose-6-phosphate isomerase [Sphingomonas sp. SUN039]UVO52763.1 class I mannose-6-phosphate isomerase [Sphingomonas sp. SUN039]
MPAKRLTTLRVEKPWGRHKLWPGFGDVPDGGAAVGEIWFDAKDVADPELMVKYLFTSERLSIQVHPDDATARAAGYKRGKDEAWLVLAAEPDSTIALGTREVTSREALAAGALDGAIVDMVDWKPVKAGDVIYSAAGAVHAIGAGITLIEVQQNVDLTYRLYDYGRPRALHLEAGIAVSNPVPFVAPPVPGEIAPGRTILCEGGKFVLERWSWDGARTVTLPDGVSGWLVPVTGGGTVDGAAFAAGECWMADGSVEIAPDAGSDILFAYPLKDRVDLFA